jgi:hypothetical protein
MARTKESEEIAAATASNARNKSTVVGFWPRVPFLRTRTNVFGAVQKPKAQAPKAALPIEPPVAKRKRTADDGDNNDSRRRPPARAAGVIQVPRTSPARSASSSSSSSSSAAARSASSSSSSSSSSAAAMEIAEQPQFMRLQDCVRNQPNLEPIVRFFMGEMKHFSNELDAQRLEQRQIVSTLSSLSVLPKDPTVAVSRMLSPKTKSILDFYEVRPLSILHFVFVFLTRFCMAVS